MILSFPEFYFDELIYSAVARFYDHMGYHRKTIATVIKLFGSYISAVSDLPTHLDQFCSAISAVSKKDPLDAIYENTLLPFYAPFLPRPRLDKVIDHMRQGKGHKIHTEIGIIASAIPLKHWLYYCPLCVAHDRQVHGEAYWHRVHQISGVQVCPIHKVWLVQSEARVRRRNTNTEFFSAEKTIHQLPVACPLDGDSSLDQLRDHIACDAAWLLGQRNLMQDTRTISEEYKRLLQERGFATYNGNRIYGRKLTESFIATHPDDLLRQLGCIVPPSTNMNNWLIRMARDKRSIHPPLYHLLLLHFFGLPAEAFFSRPFKTLHFGPGPWPCLNPTCACYRKMTVASVDISYTFSQTRRHVGTFTCQLCGFAYARCGPDPAAAEIYRSQTIKSFGHVWEDTLKGLWADLTVTLKEMSGRLGVSKIVTKRHAFDLGLAFPRVDLAGNRITAPGTDSMPKTDYRGRRAQWDTLWSENKELTLEQIFNKYPAIRKVYVWLRVHDPEWVKMHRPPENIRAKPKPRTPTTDWSTLDLALTAKAQELASQIYVIVPPQRVSISRLRRALGNYHIYVPRRKKLLPNTFAELERLAEKAIDFTVRRIEFQTEAYLIDHTKPSRSKLIEAVSAYNYFADPKVKAALDQAFRRLGI